MMKYVYCILLGVFLISGGYLVTDQALPEFRSSITGTVNVQSRVQHEYDAKTIIKQSDKENSFHPKKESHRNFSCELGDGISGYSFSLRTISPSKTLRAHIPSITIRMLSSLKTQLPEKSGAASTHCTNPTKYSYRYYVYTLGRILI